MALIKVAEIHPRTTLCNLVAVWRIPQPETVPLVIAENLTAPIRVGDHVQQRL